jgi:hypothetical protein
VIPLRVLKVLHQSMVALRLNFVRPLPASSFNFLQKKSY